MTPALRPAALRRRCLGVLAVAALALAGCGDDNPDRIAGAPDQTSAPAAAPRRVRLMLNWTANAHHLGIFVAQQRHWYADAGLDVEILEASAGGVSQALAAGQIDVGISVAEDVLAARAAGVPVVSIGAILPHNDSSLMSLASDGITRPKDLEGKTYGGFGGALETELISRLVRCDGGDPTKVKMVEVGDVDYLVGMERDAYDVAWVFSGWDALRATAVEGKAINEIRFADHFDCIPDWYTPLFAASETTIANDPDLLRSFLAVTARGYQAAVEDPAAAAEDFMTAVPEGNRALIEASAAYHATRFIEPGAAWGTQDPQVWADFAGFTLEAGLLSTAVDPARAWTNELLPAPG